MKLMRVFCLLLAVLMLFGCGKEARIVHCDGCGCELTVEADSNMTDEWIIYCHDCEVKFFGEDGLVSDGSAG